MVRHCSYRLQVRCQMVQKVGYFPFQLRMYRYLKKKKMHASSGQTFMEEILKVTIIVIELTVKITNKFLTI